MRADDRTADRRGLADVILGFDRSYSNDTYLSGLRVLSGTDYNFVTQLRCDGRLKFVRERFFLAAKHQAIGAVPQPPSPSCRTGHRLVELM